MKSSRPFHHQATKRTQGFAKKLRQKATEAEELFWQMARNRKLLNLKIRRQHPIGPFVADFYCHELKLVIEIDGNIHDLPEVKQKDKAREDYLKSEGLEVLRFRNEDVEFNPHIIEEELKSMVIAMGEMK